MVWRCHHDPCQWELEVLVLQTIPQPGGVPTCPVWHAPVVILGVWQFVSMYTHIISWDDDLDMKRIDIGDFVQFMKDVFPPPHFPSLSPSIPLLLHTHLLVLTGTGGNGISHHSA